MYNNITIEEYIEVLASNEPTPGGGSSLALVCGNGLALLLMAARVSVKKREAKGVDAVELVTAIDGLLPLVSEAVELIDVDSVAYQAIIDAMKLPKGDEVEKAERTAAMQKAFINSAEVCLQLIDVARAGLVLADVVVNGSDKNIVSDAYIGKALLGCVAEAQKHTATVNIEAVRDESVRLGLMRRLEG
jgi:formiminotetrahydrofolate cyclodeaminase